MKAVQRLVRAVGGYPAGTVVLMSATDRPSDGIPAGYPTASSTGVQAGVVLTSAGVSTASDPQWRTTSAGQVVEGVDFENRRLLVQHDNVTIRNCRVRSSAEVKVLIDGGKGTVIEFCDIAGVADTDGGCGIGNAGYTARYNKITRCEDGFRWGAATTLVGNFTDSLSIKLLNTKTGERVHADGAQTTGCPNVAGVYSTLQGNTFHGVRTDGSKVNSGVIIGCENADVANVLIEGNYMIGGSFEIMAKGEQSGHTITNVTIRGNLFGGATYGDIQYQPDVTGYTISNSGGTRVDGTPVKIATY